MRTLLGVLVVAERHFMLIVWGLIALFSAVAVATALGRWRGLSAYEPEWIAKALVTGNGYSFDGSHRWLFHDSRADQYFTTAWAEPLFTFVYAGLICSASGAGSSWCSCSLRASRPRLQ